MGDASTQQPAAVSTPWLKQTPTGYQLISHGKPFLVLGAELQNSSFSCPDHMQDVWPRLKSCNVNTVLANVSWEAIEPQQGHFDFSRVDQVIFDARSHGLHLILLWFGAFKNGKSTYAPRWIKTDAKQYPRAMLRKSRGVTEVTDVLSLFHSEVVQADAAAFGMLMRHIREIDEHDSTVLMVQVENEVGLLGDSRDVSPEANKRFNDPVPNDFVTMLTQKWDSLHSSLQKNLEFFLRKGFTSDRLSWPKTFGDSPQTDELFMAYHYALYVEKVARAGKEEYSIPLFTNVWQNYADEDADKTLPVVVGGGGEPGDYPSGGGVVNVLDIWQLLAPSLDFIAPDSYLNDYDSVCRKYRHRGQPLFIPEQRRDEYGARRVWSAYGTHHALCASPFGIDTLSAAENPWTKHFGLLDQVSPWILAAQEQADISIGFFFDELEDGKPRNDCIKTRFGEWDLTIERSFVFGKPGPGFGMIFHTGPARFLLVGEGFQVRFTSNKTDAVFSGIASFVEKVSDPRTKELRTGRWLNGDETRSGEVAIMPGESPDYGDFPICVTIPAKTRIAECEVYALF